jgi:hypothetical protein
MCQTAFNAALESSEPVLEALQWCAENYVTIAWGTHSRTGKRGISMSINSRTLKNYDKGTPQEQFLKLISMAKKE